MKHDYLSRLPFDKQGEKRIFIWDISGFKFKKLAINNFSVFSRTNLSLFIRNKLIVLFEGVFCKTNAVSEYEGRWHDFLHGMRDTLQTK